MQGWLALGPVDRTAKDAREIPTDPLDPTATSSTIIPFGGFGKEWIRKAQDTSIVYPTDFRPHASTAGRYEVRITIRHTGGANRIYLVYGTIAWAGGSPTTNMSLATGETASFELAAMGYPFHVLTDPGSGATETCVVESFIKAYR